ncbi:MAG: hypothetical protein RR911_08090, partial [Oscillospiraceae bacterium]
MKRKLTIGIIIIIILLLIVPIILGCLYANPSGDDYSYYAFHNRTEVDTLSETLGELNTFVSGHYNGTQGTFFSYIIVYLMTLTGIEMYSFWLVVLMLLFFGSLFYFVFTLFRAIFKTLDWTKILVFYAGICVLTQLITPNTLFFSLHCMIAYLLPLSLCVLMSSLVIKMLVYKDKLVINTMILSLLGVASCGSILIYPVFLLEAFFMITLFLRIKKSKLTKYFLIIFIVLCVATLANIAAPGYQNRLNLTDLQGVNLANVLVASSISTFELIAKYALTTPIIAVLLLSIPFIHNNCKDKNCNFMNPLLLLCCSFVLIISLFIPLHYGMGVDYMAPRYAFPALILFFILFFINMINFYGWLNKKYPEHVQHINKRGVLYLLAVLSLGISFVAFPISSYNSVVLIKGFNNHSIQSQHYADISFRNELEAYRGKDDVILHVNGRVAKHPFFYRIGITGDSAYYNNGVVGAYYQNKSVKLL